MTKQRKIEQAKRLLLTRDDGISVAELSKELGVDYTSAWRYMREIGAVEIEPESARYILVPNSQDVELALAVLRRASIGKQDA